jgi:hypothetical protein
MGFYLPLANNNPTIPMKKVVFNNLLVRIIVLACLIYTGCGKHTGVTPNDPNPTQSSNSPLVHAWNATDLQFGKITGVDTVWSDEPFIMSIPKGTLTIKANGTYTWDVTNGTWNINADGKTLEFNSNTAGTATNPTPSTINGGFDLSSYTGTIISLSTTRLVLQFSGTFYYYDNTKPSVVYTGVERMTFN